MKYIKYFIEFLFIISLFAIFKIIGLKNASALGEKIGIAIGPLFRSKTIIRKNINFAFPNINSSDQKKIIHQKNQQAGNININQYLRRNSKIAATFRWLRATN